MGSHALECFPPLIWPLFKRCAIPSTPSPSHTIVGTRRDGRRWWHRRAVPQGDADVGSRRGVRRVCDHLGHHRILHTFPWEGATASFTTLLYVFVTLAIVATWTSGLLIIHGKFLSILLVLLGIVCSGSKRSIRRPCLKPWKK